MLFPAEHDVFFITSGLVIWHLDGVYGTDRRHENGAVFTEQLLYNAFSSLVGVADISIFLLRCCSVASPL